VAVAALLVWREKPVEAAATAATIGVLLLLAGIAIPGRLGPLYRAWMGLALLLSKVTTPVFMGLVYYVVLTPIGQARRLGGRNALARRPDANGYWANRAPGDRRGDLTRQF
jgi:hypothetical protein